MGSPSNRGLIFLFGCAGRCPRAARRKPSFDFAQADVKCGGKAVSRAEARSARGALSFRFLFGACPDLIGRQAKKRNNLPQVGTMR